MYRNLECIVPSEAANYVLFRPDESVIVKVVNYTCEQEAMDEFMIKDFRLACASRDWGAKRKWNRFPIRVYDSLEIRLDAPGIRQDLAEMEYDVIAPPKDQGDLLLSVLGAYGLDAEAIAEAER